MIMNVVIFQIDFRHVMLNMCEHENGLGQGALGLDMS